MSRRVIAAVMGFVVCGLGAAEAQVTGRKIDVKDGDLILVNNADRVRIVRRREAQVRTIQNSQQQWLVVLVDYGSGGAQPDGRVDSVYRCEQVAGAWPLGERWEGRAFVDEYSLAGEGGFFGLGISAPTGLTQMIGPGEAAIFRDPAAAAAVTFRRISRGGSGLPFDVAEKQQMMALGVLAGQPSSTGPLVSGPQPIRVGGAIKTPTKIYDVRPGYPEAAQRARITGMVILEAVVGTDGTVQDLKVLQSIPELDAAALDAVRQWRFTPTLVDGIPVPVIMTVTVNFSLR